METTFNKLKEGQKFRFPTDALGTIRTALQIGKTEIYCPIDGSNTMGHSKGGGEEVYLKGEQTVILLDVFVLIAKVKITEDEIRKAKIWERERGLDYKGDTAHLLFDWMTDGTSDIEIESTELEKQ